LISPFSVFGVSLFSAGLDGGDGLVVVLDGLGEVDLGGGEDVGIFGDGSFQ
jgi:hypothetical protein